MLIPQRKSKRIIDKFDKDFVGIGGLEGFKKWLEEIMLDENCDWLQSVYSIPDKLAVRYKYSICDVAIEVIERLFVELCGMDEGDENARVARCVTLPEAYVYFKFHRRGGTPSDIVKRLGPKATVQEMRNAANGDAYKRLCNMAKKKYVDEMVENTPFPEHLCWDIVVKMAIW